MGAASPPPRRGRARTGAGLRAGVPAAPTHGPRAPADELELLRCERYFARSRYLPSRGSTRTRWPSLMKSGTCTVTPFESLAGFVLAVFVALRMTGDVSTTSSSITEGRSIAMGRPL